MLTEAQRTKRNRAGHRDWYAKNSEDYNAVRRARYANNKEAREKARERAANYRQGNPSIERQLFRDLDGKRVPVLSTGQVAELMNRTPQMIRNWQKEGMIPESVFPDKHRLYTKRQARLLVRLDTLIRANGGSWAVPVVKKHIAKIKENW